MHDVSNTKTKKKYPKITYTYKRNIYGNIKKLKQFIFNYNVIIVEYNFVCNKGSKIPCKEASTEIYSNKRVMRVMRAYFFNVNIYIYIIYVEFVQFDLSK